MHLHATNLQDIAILRLPFVGRWCRRGAHRVLRWRLRWSGALQVRQPRLSPSDELARACLVQDPCRSAKTKSEPRQLGRYCESVSLTEVRTGVMTGQPVCLLGNRAFDRVGCASHSLRRLLPQRRGICASFGCSAAACWLCRGRVSCMLHGDKMSFRVENNVAPVQARWVRRPCCNGKKARALT